MTGYCMPAGPKYFPQHLVSKNILCSSFGVGDKAAIHLKLIQYIFVFHINKF
jgi:hypothetical protein